MTVHDHRPEEGNRKDAVSSGFARRCIGCPGATVTHTLPSGAVAHLCDACFAAKPQPAVYFIRAAELVKIGYSKNVGARLRALRTASATPLELWFSIDGSRELEGALHRRFQADRSHTSAPPSPRSPVRSTA